MITLLWAALAVSFPSAAAAPCDPRAALASLRAYDAGARDAYLCLADHPDGATILTTALDAEAPIERPSADAAATPTTPEEAVRVASDAGRPEAVHARTTRCLALWLLEHADTPWDPGLVRRIDPDDRRLIADGIFARRGRASPSPDHAAVFQQLSWYQPDPRYTDNRLTAGDRANIAMADRPPAAPVVAAPSVAPGPPTAAPGASACGCNQPAGDSPPDGLLAGLGAVGLLIVGSVGRRRAGPQIPDSTHVGQPAASQHLPV